jgi:hypothetical protein
MRKLDEYDYRLIHCFKQQKESLQDLKQVWADRCALPIDYVQTENITNYLLELAFDLNLITPEFVKMLDFKKNFYFTCLSRDEYFCEATIDFQKILLSRLASLFGNTNVDYLPGYAEFRKNDVDSE